MPETQSKTETIKGRKQYTLLFVPESGLFHDGRRFVDGKGNEISWKGNIPVFPSKGVAEKAKQFLIETRGENCLRYVIIGYQPYDGTEYLSKTEGR